MPQGKTARIRRTRGGIQKFADSGWNPSEKNATAKVAAKRRAAATTGAGRGQSKKGKEATKLRRSADKGTVRCDERRKLRSDAADEQRDSEESRNKATEEASKRPKKRSRTGATRAECSNERTTTRSDSLVRRKGPSRARARCADLGSLAKRLHASAVPEQLPSRQHQFENIFDFLSSNIATGKSASLYISGVPGTGKTATVHKVGILFFVL